MRYWDTRIYTCVLFFWYFTCNFIVCGVDSIEFSRKTHNSFANLKTKPPVIVTYTAIRPIVFRDPIPSDRLHSGRDRSTVVIGRTVSASRPLSTVRYRLLFPAVVAETPPADRENQIQRLQKTRYELLKDLCWALVARKTLSQNMHPDLAKCLTRLEQTSNRLGTHNSTDNYGRTFLPFVSLATDS